jgi:ribonuclease P protein component
VSSSPKRAATCLGSTPNNTAPLAFGKDLRLRRRAEFLRIQKRGRKNHSANFVVSSLVQSPARESRFGFSVSRRVGNSVVRNRVKRRLREFVRLNRRELVAARDFVVIAKPGAAKLSYAELVAELRGRFSI